MNHRLIAGSLMCALLLTACSTTTPSKEPTTEQTQPTGTAVEVQPVGRTNLSNESMVSGQIIADTTVPIVPLMGGTVKTLAVKAGDTVKKGQLLFQIDTTQIASTLGPLQQSYNATQEVTNQAIQTAQAALPLAQTAVTNAQTNYDNTLELFEIGAASQVEVDQARLQLDQANNQLEQAKSSVAQARASQKAQLAQIQSSIAQLNAQIASATVTAPCDGLVTQVGITQGGMAGQSGAAVTIAEGGRTRISVQVSEDLLRQIKVGDTARVTVSAISEQPFMASIASIAPAADPQTALYEVRLYTPESVVYPIGAFADVTFFVNQRQDTVAIPSDAILTDGTESYVFIAQEDNTAKKVVIQTGVAGAGITEVTSGLTGGEQLVTKGQSYLSDGSQIRMITEETAQ